MGADVDVEAVAGELQVSVGLLRRTLGQTQVKGELTLPETSALARLDRGGPATVTALAKREQISAQSMGTTLGALEAPGLVEPRPDPDDGRRVVMSVTTSGLQVLQNHRNARVEQLVLALSSGFTRPKPNRLRAAVSLIQPLAQSI